jgi:hypothetical protein
LANTAQFGEQRRRQALSGVSSRAIETTSTVCASSGQAHGNQVLSSSGIADVTSLAPTMKASQQPQRATSVTPQVGETGASSVPVRAGRRWRCQRCRCRQASGRIGGGGLRTHASAIIRVVFFNRDCAYAPLIQAPCRPIPFYRSLSPQRRYCRPETTCTASSPTDKELVLIVI